MTALSHRRARSFFHRRLVAPLTLLATVASLAVAFTAAPAAGAAPKHAALATLVGVKKYYMAVGDSLAFGYQPNLNWGAGYSTDFANQMKATHGLSTYDNLACPGETSVTMLNGGCPYWYARKYFYTGSQMSAALNYLGSHAGQVSPVTLDMGANDLGNCYANKVINTTCANAALATVSTNLPIIVGKLKTKLNGTGDLLLMNYYDPYQNESPNTLPYVQQLNAIIANVGATYGVRVVDVYSIYHTGSYPNGGNPYVCNWTWMCGSYNDIHANSAGYSQIAAGFESASGY
jgi:lysophospholipase L1-like esterase